MEKGFPNSSSFRIFFLLNFGPSSNKQTQLHQPRNLVDYNVAKHSLSSYLVTYAPCNVSSKLVEKLFVILWSYICHNQIKAQKPNKLFYKIESITKSWFSTVNHIYYSQRKKKFVKWNRLLFECNLRKCLSSCFVIISITIFHCRQILTLTQIFYRYFK